MDKPFVSRGNFTGPAAPVNDGASGTGFAVARGSAEPGAELAIADVNFAGAKPAAGLRLRVFHLGAGSVAGHLLP